MQSFHVQVGTDSHQTAHVETLRLWTACTVREICACYTILFFFCFFWLNLAYLVALHSTVDGE